MSMQPNMGNYSSLARSNASPAGAGSSRPTHSERLHDKSESCSGVARTSSTMKTATNHYHHSNNINTTAGTPQSQLSSIPPLPVLPTPKNGHSQDHSAMCIEDQKAALVATLEAEFHCSHDCAVSTVEANHPCEDKCRAVVQAKMTASYIEVVGLVSKQREYLDKLCADLRSTFAHFPLLNGSMKEDDSSSADAVDSKTVTKTRPPIDWAAVREALFAQDKARLLYQHAEIANVGVPNDLSVLENAYQALVIKKGFSHLIGCYASGDGVVAAMDYVNERLCGTPVQELARRMHFEPEVVKALNGAEANAPTPVQTCVNAFGNDPGTSHTKRQDKGSSQEALHDAGLAYIRSVVTTRVDEAIEKIREAALLLPVVVKPSTGAGSEFVTLCYTEMDVVVAFRMVEGMRTSQGTDAEVLVVEEYIEGPEYVVNTVSYNGVAAVTDVWQSWKFPKAVFTTGMSHAAEQNLSSSSLNERKRNKTSILYDKQILVSDLASLPPEHEARRVVEYTLKCLDALELRNGCAHCEVRVDMRESSAERRRRKQQQQQTGAESSSAPSSPCTPLRDDVDVKGSPVLIELNPRMQGDAPRSTEVVGYDQFSLMVYIGEAVNTFGGATAASTQLPFRLQSSTSTSSHVVAAPSVHGDIPWPPVPRFYHPLNRSNPPCVTVLFLVASSDCILNGAALPHLTGLTSFERFTRTIFKPNLPGYVTPLRQTVDLFSSPSACVMRGTPEQVEVDCATIRAMEAADVPAVTKSMLQDAVSKTESIRIMRSALYNAERRLEYLKEASSSGNDDDLPLPSMLVTGNLEVAEDAAENSGSPDRQLLLAEAQKCRDALMANVLGLKAHLDELRAAIKSELLRQSPPPLYICNDTFNLMKHCDLGSVLSVV